jgi:hypothetical protein
VGLLLGKSKGYSILKQGGQSVGIFKRSFKNHGLREFQIETHERFSEGKYTGARGLSSSVVKKKKQST